MGLRFSFSRDPFSLRCGKRWIWLSALAMVCFGGCGNTGGAEDPQLKPIRAMLEQQLPSHTPEEKVVTFLDNHGYSILAAQKQGTIVAIIRRKDTAAVQPVLARVTFYFDAKRKLNTFELERPENEASRR